MKKSHQSIRKQYTFSLQSNLRKTIICLFVIALIIVGCASPKVLVPLAVDSPIMTSLDLTKVVDDKMPVTINPGRITSKTVTYRLPRIVQGTYSVSDFGRYVEDFKAFDYKGKEMQVSKLDINSWTINNAKNLDRITYLVNDTYDIEKTSDFDVPLSPHGTNIEAENYVLNLHGFIGYFDTLKTNEYHLNVTAPSNFKHSSALEMVDSKLRDNGTKMVNSYVAKRYFDITDNPMMYGNLDIEEFEVDGIKIVLSVYSQSKKYTAKDIKETMVQMVQAQMTYLGDFNTTNRYDIYLYLSNNKENSPGGYGALEHHTSTMVVMPETWTKEKLDRVLFDMVAHEFFHIITPLNVHSQNVHYFDYDQPTFSKHLWMYEGVTEYFARLFQVDQGLINPEVFYAILSEKVKNSKGYDDQMGFTEMSEKILGSTYSTNYPNVYQKGALVAMCIDILMREESDGKRSMLSLMKELSEKYGKDKPFQDDLLIDEITSMTYPSIGAFLKTHVEGTTPITYQEYFDKVGLVLEENALKSVEEPSTSQQNLRNSWLHKKNANVTIIENVNVIPMNEEIVLKNQRVVVSDGKIVSISPQSKETLFNATLTVDGSGKYLIPGLSEMHYHYRNEERSIESEFKLLIANGITTARNMAAYRWHKIDHVAVKNKIASGEIMGPNYYTTGPYMKLDDLKTFEKVIEAVALHKEKGYDYLKIADNLPKDIYLKLLEEAQINGVDIIGHAQRKLPLEYSLRMKSIEHVEEFIYINNGDENYSYLNNDIADLNKAAEQVKISGIYLAPTLVTFDYVNQVMNDEKFRTQQKSPLVKYLTPAERPEWLTEENPYRKIRKRKFDGVLAPVLFGDYLTWMNKFTKILSDHGVPFLTGSDTFGMVIVGFSLHEELRLLTETGLTPYEALRASTVSPARYLNTMAIEGTISEGKNANMVLLNKNPLEDISNTKTIEGVMLKGKWFDRNELDQMLLEVEQLND
jgi:predicted metalloprotease with PDZ domain